MVKSRETRAENGANIYFDPFRLEQTKRLWREGQWVDVRPRSLAVLRYLAERSGQLVTSDELLKQLWPGIFVTRTVLRVCVRELRHALQDDPTTPQFIETVGRQGYRFIAPIVTTAPPVVSDQVSVVSADKGGTQSPQLATGNWQLATPFVGRRQELARLHELFERAQQGEHQLMFLLGEPGIGKTTLVERFLEQILQGARVPEGEANQKAKVKTQKSKIGNSSLAPGPQPLTPVLIGRGQCVEHYGLGEAYLPLLEAFGQLCRESGGEQVLAVLRRHAPMWLAQMPGLLKTGELEAVQRQVQGSGRVRMLRELAGAIEAVAADTMLVLVLEDLQWSDRATLEAIEYLARRRHPMRLYILGTYRPADVVVSEHPLRQVVQELYGRRQCEELPLDPLTETEVEEYLEQRFGQSAALTELSRVIYHRTDGNALFVVSFVDSLLQQGLLVEVNGQVQLQADRITLKQLVPNNLQKVILRQVESLPADEQQLLRVASVSGRTFTAAEVAEVIERGLEEVEEVYDHLASRERVIAVVGLDEWPDRAVTVRYEFRHALYQQVLYEQFGQARRVRLHRQVGEWKEGRYGEQAAELAGELALHFTEGRDYRRAAHYHKQVGLQALRRYAPREALMHCTKGLELLSLLPETPERIKQELTLRMTLGPALTATHGQVSSEAEQNLTRAHTLCQDLNDPGALVPVLTALTRLYMMRADRAATDTFLEQQRQLLLHSPSPADAIQLHTQIGTVELMRGAHARSQEHYTRALELHDASAHRSLFLTFGFDPKSTALASYGWSLCLSGWPEQAWSWERGALDWAEELAHPLTLVNTLMFAVFVKCFCGEVDEALALTQQFIAVGSEHGFTQYLNGADLLQGSVLVESGELERSSVMFTTGLSQYRTTPARLMLPYFLSSFAEASLRQGQVENGLAAVTEALHLTATNLGYFWEAELYRLKGELTLQQESQKSKIKSQKSKVPKPKSQILALQSEAEECFHKAIEIAQQQGAKSLELRATMSLARLWQQQGKQHEARNTLSAIYGWFTEGFDTKDLQEARALLDALRG